MIIVFLSHTAPGFHFKVGSHHYSRELATRGHTVAHISAPVSILHYLKRDPTPNLAARARNRLPSGTVAESVCWISPAKLLPLCGFRPPHSIFLNTRSMAASRAWIERAEVVIVDEPRFVAHLGIGNATVVYRPTDIQTVATARRAEHHLVPYVHTVVTTTDAVRDALPERLRNLHTRTIPNGVEVRAFESIRSMPKRARAVYVGAIDFRFDADAVKELAEAAPNLPIELYGPVSIRLGRLPANIHLHGPLANSAVPEVLSRCTIGLMPFRDIPANVGRSPMKRYEYLAAGLNILASDHGSSLFAGEPGVVEYRSLSEIRDLVAILLARPFNIAGQELAHQMSWETKAAELEDVISRTVKSRDR